MAETVRFTETQSPLSCCVNTRLQYNALIAWLEATVAGDLDNPAVSNLPGLTIGTTDPEKIRIANAITVYVAGVPVRLSAQEVAFTATTHDIADPDANPREAIYVLSVDDTGSLTITKGNTAAAGAAVAPSTPAGEAKLGEVLIQHDGTAIFDATTDELSEAHLTVTFTDAGLVIPSLVKGLNE